MANGGFQRMSDHLAGRFEDKFKDFDYIVTPSVSCAAFVRVNYPQILDHECQTPKRTMELVEFLHDVLKVKELPGSFPHVVSVHNSCHGVRELTLSTPSELQHSSLRSGSLTVIPSLSFNNSTILFTGFSCNSEGVLSVNSRTP